MKCVLLFTAVFAAWLGSSDAVKCQNITQCSPDFSKISGESEKDIKEACKALNSAFECFRGALDDCKSNANMPKQTLDQLQHQMDQVQDLLSEKCGSSSATTIKMSAAAIFFSTLALFV